MKRIVLPLALAAALPLGGCVVTSETPLFGPEDATRRPLAQGLWGLSGPGCDVAPGKDLPECALAMTISGGKLNIDVKSLASSFGEAGQGALAGGGGGAVKPDEPLTFLMVDGAPAILQLVNEGKADATGQANKPGYMAVSALHANAAGQIDKAAIWMVSCPKKGQDTTGFKITGVECVALDKAAVRRRAPFVPPPPLSFFITWVKPGG
jgi:hypothetical protein